MSEFFSVFFLLSSIPPDRLGRCLVMHFYKKKMHAPAQHTHNAIEFQMMLLSNLDSIFIYYSFLNRWTRTRWTYAVEFSFFLNVCCIKWMRLNVVCMCVFFLAEEDILGKKCSLFIMNSTRFQITALSLPLQLIDSITDSIYISNRLRSIFNFIFQKIAYISKRR